MPQRKMPEKNIWARIVNGEWCIYLPTGETLTPRSVLAPGEAIRLARTLPVYVVAFLRPVEELTGHFEAVEAQAALVVDLIRPGTNTVARFTSPEGREAVVFENHH